jgi:glycerol kinase
LVGLRAGIFAELSDVAGKWKLEQRFQPVMPPEAAAELYDGWQNAVARVRS